MLTINTKLQNLLAAAACSLLIGLPALADDTELLLASPDPSTVPTPNVLFILDSSGSMGSEEETKQPYDPEIEFDGDCDTDLLYWTETNVVPDCTLEDDEKRAIEKDEFYCADATDDLNAFGVYTGLLAQYREEPITKLEFWQELEYDNDKDPVECARDSGVHGEIDGNNEVYASALTDDDEWTNVASLEVDWGSAPRHVTYSVYDGNYLNWQGNPQTVTWSRNRIMRTVMNRLLSSLDNLNVGLMRFNGNHGGVIIDAVQDLEDNRAALMTTVDNWPASGNTPLAETMNEAAQYWHGLNGYYAENYDTYVTDPDALETDSDSLYNSPVLDACAKNFNVLITDGQPTQDVEAQTLTPQLPNFAALLKEKDADGDDTEVGRTACTGTGDGNCLDDVTEWLFKADLDPIVPDVQNVVTHTVGFTVDLPILQETADVSGGDYFLADDLSSLEAALIEIIANINERSLSFTAPAVSVNAFNRTRNLNKLYLSMFSAKSRVHWPGNIKRYSIKGGQIYDSADKLAINPDTGFFRADSIGDWNTGIADGNDVLLGGAANELPDPAARVLLTNNGDNEVLTDFENQLTPANAGAFTDADFGLTGSASEPTREALIRWARGEDIKDEDDDEDTLVRYAMGDALHSQPAAVVYGGTEANPDTVVYVGTNDGYLHAIDGATGAELWSFVPFEMLSNLARLYVDPKSSYKNYGIDGNIVPVVKDENKDGEINGDDYVYIVFGLRRGGYSYYALDVTNKNAPKLMWNKGYDNFGQTWSTPVLTRIDIDTGGQNDDNAVLVIGDGYDTVHDSGPLPAAADSAGAGIHFLDVESGNDLWDAARDGADLNLDKMTRAIPSTIRVLDISGDGFADRMYAADMGGQVWRFDIFNGENGGNLVTGGVIAQLGNEGAGTPTAASNRRFYNAPDISLFTDPLQTRRYLAISIGSGYRAHPLDTSVSDYFYSLRDPDPFRKLTQDEYDDYDIITHDELIPINDKLNIELDAADRGWKFELPANQMVLADSTTFNDEVFFVGFSPERDLSQDCATGIGTNYLYRVKVVNGNPVVTNLDELLESEADDARGEKLGQGGIAPTPQILFPGADDPTNCTEGDCTPPPIGCVGVECFDPGFVNLPVRTLWTQDGIL